MVRLALAPTPDGLAYVATVVVAKRPYRVVVDTSSTVGLMLSCTALPSASRGNASACLASANATNVCPANSIAVPLLGSSMCKATTPIAMTLELGELGLAATPTTILTSNATALLRGTDGLLGLAAARSGQQLRAAVWPQIRSFAIDLTGTEPYLLLNDALPTTAGRTSLRQLPSLLNHSTVAVRGFSESVNKSFVTKKFTQAALQGVSHVVGWVDVGWPSLVFPASTFDAFYAKYLKFCVPGSEMLPYEKPKFYNCAANASLPRLAFTMSNGTFFLDRDDYVEPDPRDPSRSLVMVQNASSAKYWLEEWGLGLPFARKFPAFFDGTGNQHTITLHCTPGATCDLDKWVVNGSPGDPSANYGLPTRRNESTQSGSGVHWSFYVAIPMGLMIMILTGRKAFKQWKILLARRRMRHEAVDAPPSTDQAAPTSANKQPSEMEPADMPMTPSSVASYNLLGGPATLTVSSNTMIPTPARTSLPAIGVTSRLRGDLADLETRV